MSGAILATTSEVAAGAPFFRFNVIDMEGSWDVEGVPVSAGRQPNPTGTPHSGPSGPSGRRITQSREMDVLMVAEGPDQSEDC